MGLNRKIYMKRLVLISIILFGFFSSAQLRTNSYTLGNQHAMVSKVLNDTIQLNVHLPEGYNTAKTYPTLYILDGQHNYIKGVDAVGTLTRFNKVPECIVVGIITEGENRGNWLFSNPDTFINGLESDIIPYIDTQFKTSDERIIFGWEVAGGVVLELLSKKPSLFNAYLAASPTPIYGAYFPTHKKQFKALKEVLASEKANGKFLYVTQSHGDFPVQYGMNNLIEMLKKNTNTAFRWEYKKLSDEVHPTTPYPTIFKGIQAYFFDYPKLDMQSFETFKKLGGLSYIETYHKQRQKRYGFTSEETKEDLKKMRRSLVISAISYDNFEAFQYFMNAFGFQEFMNEQFLNHGYWYGRYYLQNNAPKEAMRVFQFLVAKFPDQARAYKGLGEVYAYLNDYPEAKKFFKKTVAIAKKNSDWRLGEYEDDLEKLNQ